MTENDVSVESVELALLSEIGMSSAVMMKNAYLPHSGEKPDEERGVTDSQPGDSHQKYGLTGPNVLVYVTKISNRTPSTEIEQILNRDPDRRTNMGNHDFYTVVLTISMRMDDPSTTRFINGTIDVAFPHGIKILTYSPQKKGIITAIIEMGGDAISLTQGLDFFASPAQGTTIQPDPKEKRFEITVGPEEKITGTYNKKSGYSLKILPSTLLDYLGMPISEHEMFWEIFPPMPGQDIEITGKETLAVFSFIVEAPKNSPLPITARIEGRVKGNLWGVVPLKGSIVL